jgi:glycosidase
VIYYGEELGMRGSRGGESTDANRRLAMLWGDDDLIRDPVGSTYPADKQIPTTAATQMADGTSLYNYYCKLISIRHKYPAIARGDYTAVNIEKNLGGFVIRLGDETLLLLHNTSMEELTLDLSALTGTDGFIPDGILDFVGVGNAKLEGSILTVGPQTSVVLG